MASPRLLPKENQRPAIDVDEDQVFSSTANILSEVENETKFRPGQTSQQVNCVAERGRIRHFCIFVRSLKGLTGSLVLAVLAAVSGTSFHFGYGTGVM